MSLDVSSKQFQEWIKQAEHLVTDYYKEVSDRKVFAGKPPQEVQSLFNEPLPQTGNDMQVVLQEVKQKVLNSVTNSAGPRYFGYITGGGNQAAVLAEMLKATLNQNNLKWHSSPVSTELEKLVMRWVAEFIGYPTTSAGVLLSGGSAANFNCMAVARKVKSPVNVAEDGLYNSPPQTVYVSAEGHSSFDKAVDMLGIGKKYLRKIPVTEALQIDIQALEKAIIKDKEAGFHPLCAVAVAGTTNSGAVDDLNAVAEIAEKYGLWYHIDAAYGGPAAALEGISSLFNGIDRADSVVVNPHKWMYVPFEAGGLLVKNQEHLRATFSTIPDYLKSDDNADARTDLMEYNLPLTKEFKALKVWMTFKTYGSQKLKQAIQNDIDKASLLAELVREDPRLELMAPVPLSIVCFRYWDASKNIAELDKLNDQIVKQIEKDGRIFLTGTKVRDHTALRVCFINHRTTHEDVRLITEVIKEIGDSLL